MTYATQQLQGMEDADINEAIAKKLGMVINSYCGDAVMCGYEGLRSTFADRDYCKNPNDTMPLAFERNISLIRSEAGINLDTWCACHGVVIQHGEIECDLSYAAQSPLRAIACLLLMMED